jgi:hypothetical protein
MSVIAVTTIPGWPSPVAGVMESLSSLMACSISPDGLHVADGSTATTFLNTYVGSATELSWNKTQKQIALDALLDNHFDLTAFIRAGTVTTLTATNIGTFLATISNNYRTLRASIAVAADLTTLNAININAGWPSNP